MSLKKNVVANYFGQAWQALMGLAFVPLYIRYLGIESYGLIGIFAMLQTWLALIDMGMKPALGREMARFTAGSHDARSIRDLLRSVEVVGVVIAAVLGLAVWAASGWLAIHWVTAKNLSPAVIAHAFSAMGLVTALRFVEDIYQSSIAGLQRQVLQNVVTSITAGVRSLGAIGVLAWVSPTIEAFFFWQGLVSLISVAALAAVVYTSVPPSPQAARFSTFALRTIWRFAAGMTAITLLGLLLTQVDKILLARLLTLEAFGYYALAGVVANGLYSLAGPITSAIYPRLTQLVASGDDVTLRAVYHRGAQLVTVLMGSAAMVLIVFGERVLQLWTGNAMLARQVWPVMSILALGTLFNGLMLIPLQIQLAHGWTSLAIRVNIVAVSLLVPAIIVTVPRYGALGAARVWVVLNLGYLLFEIPLMHRRLLRAEKWRWYREDVVFPLAAAAATVLLCRWLMPRDLGRVGEFSALFTTSACVLIASAMAAPTVRDQLARFLPGRGGRGVGALARRAGTHAGV